MNLKSTLVLLSLFGMFLLTLSIVKSNAFSGNDFLNQKEASQLVNMPDIIGPDRVCLVVGNVLEEFFGAGIPSIDFYQWKVTGPNGVVLRLASGGPALQTFPFTFSELGEHTIELKVRRGVVQDFFTKIKKVNVVKGAKVLLKENYDLCGSAGLNLMAIDPLTPNIGEFVFEWTDADGNTVGNANNIAISNTGNYQVRYYFVNTLGNPECENIVKTEVSEALSFSLSSNKPIACPEDFIQISSSLPLFGKWSYQKNGIGTAVSMGSSKNLGFRPSVDLDGYGDYTISLSIENPDLPGCEITNSLNIKYNPSPSYDVIVAEPASGCSAADGSLTITAFTDLDQLYYEIDPLTISSPISLQAGQSFKFEGLQSGVYSFVGNLGGCPFNQAFVVPLANIPPELEFSIEGVYDEICTPTGKNLGGFKVTRPNGTTDAFYNLIDEMGDLTRSGVIQKDTDLIIEVRGGTYYFELFKEEECAFPRIEEIKILGLPQVDLPEVDDFNICGSYDFIPLSGDNVFFTLTDPSGGVSTNPKGTPFTLALPGLYTLLATHNSDPEFCPRQQEFTVSLISAVDFEVEFFNQDCVGNQTYRADLKNKPLNEVLIRWFNELDEEIGTGLEMYPVSYGIYKLDVQPINSFACPIPPKEFEVKRPVLQVDVELSATPLCPFGPGAIIDMDTDFDEVDRIDWVYFDLDNNQVELTGEQNKRSITVTDEGLYEAIVWNRFDCELGREIITIKKSTNLVNFDIEPVYTVCERFEVGPTTNEDLTFTITYPDGQQTIINSQETFTLNQEGSYTIRGESNDVNNLVCPNEKIFEVFIVSPIDFEPKLIDQTCIGQFTFEADIFGTDSTLALFTWRNENDQVVGDQQLFISSIPGNYSLEVQPKGSMPCDIQPKSFEIIKPVLELDVFLNAGSLCPEADFAVLVVEADFTSVAKIEWWFTDINGNQSALDQLNKQEISAFNEGTYEVRVFNALGCPLGEDRVLVLRSTDTVRPQVEEKYLICAQYEIGETINPGVFSNYNWFLNDSLVSNSANYKPQLVGEYSLVVNSGEGCEYSVAFTVEEECELKLVLPSAIRPGDPERGFLIFTNYLVDEMEVWVFNKWGTLVFHCENKSLISEESTCFWDGMIDGEKIPNGAYAIKIAFKNIEKNINKTLLKTILVVD
ncbi:hypothetical protein P872_23730 [Rhodonellum psychrophilum GCM71 = DSM 17998]|uniref:Uncharacterized protein n=2 Tax=Rhodonellum TaxID=336827 RepID=U5C4H9_9BACT|nr:MULTISPECIES: hypothetical protein [Rhodonellum]ERM84724.1 hypothetical protein P872_23730 [Rhodonellum psychrophilum GCM71 = DSM 17998]SDZ12656.1 hypothetical protein SAMN05444412_10688 [Rhodonellum ikkaensis]